MKFADIRDGRVVNIAIADRAVLPEWVPIPEDRDVDVGWTYDGDQFEYAPRVEPSRPPALQEQIAALEARIAALEAR